MNPVTTLSKIIRPLKNYTKDTMSVFGISVFRKVVTG
jgi:hypothetical protein